MENELQQSYFILMSHLYLATLISLCGKYGTVSQPYPTCVPSLDFWRVKNDTQYFLIFAWTNSHHPNNGKVCKFCPVFTRLTIQFTIPFHSLKVVCHSKPSLNKILRNSPPKGFFTIEVLFITHKINEFSVDMHFKLFTISKMKKKYNPM